jgi:hypothetical protein
MTCTLGRAEWSAAWSFSRALSLGGLDGQTDQRGEAENADTDAAPLHVLPPVLPEVVQAHHFAHSLLHGCLDVAPLHASRRIPCDTHPPDDEPCQKDAKAEEYERSSADHAASGDERRNSLLLDAIRICTLIAVCRGRRI